MSLVEDVVYHWAPCACGNHFAFCPQPFTGHTQPGEIFGAAFVTAEPLEAGWDCTITEWPIPGGTQDELSRRQ